MCIASILRLRAFACRLVLSLLAASLPALALDAGPSVKDVVEFTRIIQPADGDPESMRSLISPDGARAFIVTRKADVRTDTNVFEILLLDVRPDRLSAARAGAARAVFSVKARRDEDFGNPAIQQVQWADRRTLVFLARVSDAPIQVFRLDVESGRATRMTREGRRIVSFAVSRDLRRVVYSAQLPNPPMKEGEQSIVVGRQSFWSVKFGQNDLRSQKRVYRYFVSDGPGRRPRPLGEPFDQANTGEPNVGISPDGRWAVLPRYEPQQQLAWAARYPLIAELTQARGPSLAVDPLGYYSRPSGYVARRLVAYRLDDGSARVVVDAPDDTGPSGTSQWREDRLWQRSGRSVVIAGTHLPAAGDRSVPTGSHIIEYWPATGRWEVVAPLAGRLRRVHALDGDRFVAIDGDRPRQFERRVDGGWQETEALAAPGASGWMLQLDEGLNRPPEIVASGPAGQVVRLTSLHPRLSPGWGTMQPHSWQDARGRRWDGGLMTGPAMAPGVRHPLVIQTYGFSASRFYLDGPNEQGGGFPSAFPGRAFLREGILVLAMPWRATSGSAGTEREALFEFMDGVRGAIDSLVATGVADPARVGIIGWSATGERILNLLTFSDVPVRAATMADGDANTLFTMAVSYGAADAMWVQLQRVNDGLPFGESWERWVRNDPSLHTECVTAAVRIESYGPWVLPNWEIYALLRRQYKPAEMVLIPGGTHALSRPGQRMVSLQGNVDWYRFWLKGEERTQALLATETSQSLAAQYVRWRQMQTLKKDERAGPRCTRP